MMVMTNLDYLAGLFDGEGCITLGRVRKEPLTCSICISLGMTNEELPREFQKEFGGNLCLIPSKSVKYKPYFQWYISKQSIAKAFLTKIISKLRLRKKQAKLVLEFIEERKNPYQKGIRGRLPYSPRCYEIYSEIRELNRRGLRSVLTT